MEKIDLSISRLNILRLPCRRFKIAVFQSSIFTIFFQFCNQLCDVFKTPCPEIEVCFSIVTSVPPSCFSFSEISRKLLFTNVNCCAETLHDSTLKLKISTLPYTSHKMQENKMTFATYILEKSLKNLTAGGGQS